MAALNYFVTKRLLGWQVLFAQCSWSSIVSQYHNFCVIPQVPLVLGNFSPDLFVNKFTFITFVLNTNGDDPWHFTGCSVCLVVAVSSWFFFVGARRLLRSVTLMSGLGVGFWGFGWFFWAVEGWSAGHQLLLVSLIYEDLSNKENSISQLTSQSLRPSHFTLRPNGL